MRGSINFKCINGLSDGRDLCFTCFFHSSMNVIRIHHLKHHTKILNPSYFRVILKLIFRYEKTFKSPNAEERHKTWLNSRRYGKKNEAADASISEVTNGVTLL